MQQLRIEQYYRKVVFALLIARNIEKLFSKPYKSVRKFRFSSDLSILVRINFFGFGLLFQYSQHNIEGSAYYFKNFRAETTGTGNKTLNGNLNGTLNGNLNGTTEPRNPEP